MKILVPGADEPEVGLSGLALPTTVFSRAIDRVISWFGEFASVLWTILVMTIVLQVVLRYVFGIGSIMLEEAQWHLYAVGFLLGLAFTELKEKHVRIDVLSSGFTSKTRLWIEFLGITCFLLTFSLMVIWFALPFVISSWQLSEVSAAPGGLPYRWAIKSFLVTAFVLLALIGMSRLTRVWAALSSSR
ncbi:TRAP transporter small permease subunit [Rhodoferax sp.]|uniref:TRAP transporter small permease subunit n=1 Tax=Rhodoferax sp. TaxID=50421 RepID=UPI0025F5791B|nr:TRAP transporter small permease subunit [Rhodoferax sp.]